MGDSRCTNGAPENRDDENQRWEQDEVQPWVAAVPWNLTGETLERFSPKKSCSPPVHLTDEDAEV